MLPTDGRKERDRLDARIAHIKESVRITDLLTRLGVETSGSRGKILCIAPAHSEKTGSMKVYVETDSVYCYGCSFSADVIGVARHCVSRKGKVLSLPLAVEWLEAAFDLTPPPVVKTLTDRLGTRLGKWRTTTEEAQLATAPVGRDVAAEAVEEQLRQLHATYPGVRGALGVFEDYLWDTGEVAQDPGTWAVWAGQLIRGYATATAQRMTAAFQTSFSAWEAPRSDVPMQEALE